MSETIILNFEWLFIPQIRSPCQKQFLIEYFKKLTMSVMLIYYYPYFLIPY